MSQTAERTRTRSGKAASAAGSESSLSDSGFASPSLSDVHGGGGKILPVTTTTASLIETRSAMMTTTKTASLDDSFSTTAAFLSPPTLVRCEASASTPLLLSESGGGGGGRVSPCQYFLRRGASVGAQQLYSGRWASSTPLVQKEPQLQKSRSVPATVVVSTPAAAAEFSITTVTADIVSPVSAVLSSAAVTAAAQLSQAEFQRRLSSAATGTDTASADASLESFQSHSIDSGFESLATSTSYDTSSEHHGSSFLVPVTGGGVAVAPKRRSPRRLLTPTEPPAAGSGPQRPLGSDYTDTDRLFRLRLDRKPSAATITAAAAASYQRAASVSYLERAQVDIVRLLAERDLWGPLDLLLSHLAAPDLCAFALVCQVWNVALASRPFHEERRLSYVVAKKLDRENFGVEEAGGLLLPRRIRSSPRLAMQEVSNVKNISPSSKRNRNFSSSASSSGVAEVSPSKIRHRLFVEEAAKLPPGGRLVHCPHCSSPSRVEQQLVSSTSSRRSPTQAISSPGGSELNFMEVATCSSATCGLVFCLACRCDRHEGPCRSLRSAANGNNSRRAGGVTSKKSKARLRRL